MQRQKYRRYRIVKRSNYTKDGFYLTKVCDLTFQKSNELLLNVSIYFFLSFIFVFHSETIFHTFMRTFGNRNGQRKREEGSWYSKYIDKDEWWLWWSNKNATAVEKRKETRKGLHQLIRKIFHVD